MSNTPTINDLLGGGAPSAKFTSHGDIHKGVITKAETAQQTDFDTGKPKFYDDGNPMWQIVLTIQTDQRDPEIPNDDGERRIFVKGQMLAALRAALRTVGAQTIEAGDTIAVQYTGDGEAKRAGMSGPKQYAVQVKKGAGPVADVLGAGQPAAADVPTDLL